MKFQLAMCFIISLCLFSCQKKSPEVQIPWHNKRVLILGNSITQQGTYVSVLEYALRKKYPQGEFDIISIGLGSETLSCLTEPDHAYPRPCLKERIERALDKTSPDIILACYGMNDGIYHPFDESRLKAFQQGVHDLAGVTKAINAALTIITPPPFDSLPASTKLVDEDAPEFGYKTPFRGYDQVLKNYSDWLVSAEGSHFQVVDLHQGFKMKLKKKRRTNTEFTFAADGIHPSPEGHLLMAKLIAEGLGFDVQTIIGLSPNEVFNDPFFQLIDDRRRTTSEGWLPYVGYTREKVVANNSLKLMKENLMELDKRIMEYNVRE